MDILTLILSIIAIIISLSVAIVEYIRDYRISKTSLEADYFREIFMKHLIYNIPNARKYIRFDRNKKLKDTKNLRDELNKLRQDSLYFMYNDITFYDLIKNKSQDLENYLTSNEDKTFIGEEQTSVFNYIQESLISLYKIINDKYLGAK